MNICVIPARAGSQRIPNKNIKAFHGKPIIAYSIEAAKESGLFDEIVVSSDASRIHDIALLHGASSCHIRSREMAKNEVGTQEVVKQILIDKGITEGTICCMYATAPLISDTDLKTGLISLLSNHYTFSVGTNPLCDAGQFYWGHAESFLSDLPLISPDTRMIPVADNRVCDINTMEDWHKAEEMYAAL